MKVRVIAIPARPLIPAAHRLLARRAVRLALAVAALVLSAGAAWLYGPEPQLAATSTRVVIAALALTAVAAIGRRGLFAWIFALLIMTLGGWHQLALLDKQGWKIVEVPALLEMRRFGQSKLRIKSAIVGHLKLMSEIAVARITGQWLPTAAPSAAI